MPGLCAYPRAPSGSKTRQTPAAEFGYKRAGLPSKTNSAAAYGSVMHHALEVLERALHEHVPFEQALRKSLETFAHYWSPLNIDQVCAPVPADGWLPMQGYSVLRRKGLDTIRQYADLIRYDDNELLATEYPFIVPIVGTLGRGRERHPLAGWQHRPPGCPALPAPAGVVRGRHRSLSAALLPAPRSSDPAAPSRPISGVVLVHCSDDAAHVYPLAAGKVLAHPHPQPDPQPAEDAVLRHLARGARESWYSHGHLRRHRSVRP